MGQQHSRSSTTADCMSSVSSRGSSTHPLANGTATSAIRHPLNESTAEQATEDILSKSYCTNEHSFPVVQYPPVPTHVNIPLDISPQTAKWEEPPALDQPSYSWSATTSSRVQHSRATDFSCIRPMCTTGGWAMLSIDDGHLAMDPFKGQPLHKMISALEKTSTAVSRASLDPSLVDSTIAPRRSGIPQLSEQRQDTTSATSGLGPGPHLFALPTSPGPVTLSAPAPAQDVTIDEDNSQLLSIGSTHRQESTPVSTLPLQVELLQAISASKARQESTPASTQAVAALVDPRQAISLSTSRQESNPVTTLIAPTTPGGPLHSISPSRIRKNVSCENISVPKQPLDTLHVPPGIDRTEAIRLGLVDPLAGYAKRARLDSSISQSAALVRDHLGQSSDLWNEDQLMRLWPPPQEKLIQGIRNALAWKPKARSVPVFKFECSDEAAEHNFSVLQQNNFDLDKIMLDDPHSPLRPGSEFRPIGLLEPILGNHYLWPRVRETMLHGAQYHLVPLDEDLRKQDLEEAISFGNHQSAIKHGDATMATLRKEVDKGWQLPIPMYSLLDIPHLVKTPVGMSEQMKLQASGERVPELCLTHNMSMVFGPSGTSLNARVDTDKLSKCVYGFALVRFINAIVELRRRHPNCIIYLSKFDLKSAYRRVHLRGQAALQSCVSTSGLQETEESVLALLGLRMTFGGRPNPAIFCEITDCIVDLAIALSQCPDWSPATLPSSYSHVLKEPIRLPDDTPFAQARPSLVQLAIPEAGTADGFIDDIFSANVVTDKNQRADRLAQAVLLAIEVLGRPQSEFEPLLRDVLLSLDKAEAEGTPNELLIVLGWLLNTRRLRISLPLDKYTAWSADLRAIITPPPEARRHVTGKQMESMEGRLQNVTTVIPLAGHFMNRVRSGTRRAVKYGKTILTNLEIEQCVFWLTLLKRAFDGVSMNSVIPQVPTCIYRNDACEYGLGGFSLKTGRAWRYPIPQHLIGKRSINFLEFLSAVVSIALGIEEGEIQQHDNVLSATDNTSTQGWIPKSNFDETGDQAAHAALAQWLATMGITNDVDFSSIWFMGKLNWVADPLSRSLDFQDLAAPGKNLLCHLLSGANRNARDAVVAGTHRNEDCAWRRWIEFLLMCGIANDPFLDGFSDGNRVRLLMAFAQAIRECTWSKSTKGYDCLVSSTCKTAVHNVGKAFAAAGRPDPRYDSHGNTVPILHRLFRGYSNNDPGTTQQKAIPWPLIRDMCARQCDRDSTMDVFSKLMMLAFFFAMRSCEYLKVQKSEERRTTPLRKRNFVFMKNHTVLSHDSPWLEHADSVTLYFEFQKRDMRNDSVTQVKTGHYRDCPVKAAAAIIRRMQRQGFGDDDFIHSFRHPTTGATTAMTSKVALIMLRDFITSIAVGNFGLTAEEIGLHSMRSSSAMAMYLHGVPVYTIMLLGRWSSDAFLRYIRRQVETFGQDVSSKMIDTDIFYHVPNPDHLDPRTHNPHAATFNSGMGSNGPAYFTAFAVWA